MSNTASPEGRHRVVEGAPLLAVQGLNVAYGDVQVLWDVSLDIYPGEIVALVGANGAGKSTLLQTISGLLPPLGGSILMDGKPVGGLPAHRVAAAGIAHVPEGRRLFGALTVLENLRMGAYLRQGKQAIEEDLARMLDLFPRLKERLNTTAGKLSGGEQQMVAIARGMMARPRLLMVDELSLGLAPVILDSLLDALNQVNREGLTLLVVEQDVQSALELANYGYVLETGHVVLEGDGTALLSNPRIQQAFLGI